jgi:chemotaxis regulatin CheY-phosphate phosphatase CheZ
LRLDLIQEEAQELADAIRQIGLDSAFLHLESPLASARDTADRVVTAARASVHY